MPDEEVLPPPVNWQTEDATQKGWEEFCGWVEWYLRRWEVPVSVVPPCWQRHPVLIEELTALWTSYMGSYSRDNNGQAPLLWLYQADLARTRMLATMAVYSCGREGHSGPMLYRAPSESLSLDDTRGLGLPDHPDGVVTPQLGVSRERGAVQ